MRTNLLAVYYITTAHDVPIKQKLCLLLPVIILILLKREREISILFVAMSISGNKITFNNLKLFIKPLI